MSTQLPSLDHVVWTKATTKNGKAYEVGVTKAAISLRKKTAAGVLMKPAGGKKEEFSVFVDWPVGNSDWKDTSSDVNDKAAITKYKLYEYDGTWKYVLHFNNELHYDYKFDDESKDVYECDTWTDGDHYIRYNSDQPNITKVNGN